MTKFISVFGGAQTHSGETLYKDAYQLGRLLGLSGYTILNGGYIGVMEAVSKGAAEAGGHVIGVTCDEIEAWRPVLPNPWLKEELRFPTLRERLFALIDRCDAAVVFPGGIGTLGELAVMWSQLQIGGITPRPLVIVGKEWENVLYTMYDQLGDFIIEKHRRRLTFCTDAQEAFNYLDNTLARNFNS
ncbi:MAG: LOG family protein [Anaerolineales bacterium]|nr:LOG family protein [Anaerolineales bacterium]